VHQDGLGQMQLQCINIKYEADLMCTLCDTQADESQEHLLICPGLLEEIVVYKTVKYLDILGRNEIGTRTFAVFSHVC
jgi:hypothetical protein